MASIELFSGCLTTYGSDKLNKIRHCSTTCFGSGKSEIIVTGTSSTEVRIRLSVRAVFFICEEKIHFGEEKSSQPVDLVQCLRAKIFEA